MLPRLRLLALLFLLLAAPAMAQEKRVALVIGNGAYRHAVPLANPGNDAEGMARTLSGLGFTVTLTRDLDNGGLRRALLEFGDAARGADIALLFFAGHGLQMGSRDRSENFLIPVDATLTDVRRLEDETVRLSRVLDLMEDAKARIVILDACRDNPLLPRMANSSGSRSVGRGLAPLEGAAHGTLVAYSTAPGAVAADGRRNNSPFTEALMRHLPTRGAELRTVFTRVRADVARASGGAQTPWSNDGLLAELFLAGAAEPAPPAAVTPQIVPPAPAPSPVPPPVVQGVAPEMLELTFWQSIQVNSSQRDLEEFLLRFPNGVFAGLARNRLEELRRVAEAAAAQRAREEEERRRAEADRLRRQREEEDARRRAEAERQRMAWEAEEQRRRDAESRRLAMEEADRQRRIEADRQRMAREAEEQRRQDEQRRRMAERTGSEWTEANMALNRQDWTEIQRLLGALGLGVGVADGLAGPRTRAAIQDFQARTGVPQSGFLTYAIVTDLRSQAGPALARQEEEERRRVEAERRQQEQERLQREAEERARPRISQAVALAWNCCGVWATRAASTIERARELAVQACNSLRGTAQECTLSQIHIPANTRGCLVVYMDGNRGGNASTNPNLSDARNDSQRRCSACSEVYYFCSNPS